ncbi:MAG TPA: hypothetical protein DCS83_09215 [Prevotella sp.]|nr:hypothetical protein [Prevotella sp.]
MGKLVGPFFFSKVELSLAHLTKDKQTIMTLSASDATPTNLVIVIAVLMTVVYLFICYKRMGSIISKEVTEAAKSINSTFCFNPTQEWFENISRATIKDLGNKYDEKINYPYADMDILLASLRRDWSIKQVLSDKLRELKRKINDFDKIYNNLPNNHINNYKKYFTDIVKSLNAIPFSSKEFDVIIKCLDSLTNDLSKDKDEIYAKEKSYSYYTYKELRNALYKLRNEIDCVWLRGIKYNTIIVNGKGGIGKSHLLADIVNKRLKAHEPTIFFLGKSFLDSSEPLDQLMVKLDIKCKKTDFLKTLQDYHQRVVIVIDGINEGVGGSYWQNHLDSFINIIGKYNNIQLIVSYRSTDNNNWFDQYSKKDGHILYEHQGFKGSPAAIEFMFKSYGLPMPPFPFYGAEFSNPMFLTFYCRSHELSKKPLLYEGRKDIVDCYINEVNKNLSNKLNYNNRLNLVDEALNALASISIIRNNAWVPVDKAVKAINSTTSACSSSKNFFNSLSDEGILHIITNFDNKNYVSFGYETIGDIYVAKELVTKHEPKEWYGNNALYDEEYITYLAPLKNKKEVFEYVKPQYKQMFINKFVKIYPWRKISTESGNNIIRRILESKDYDKIFELVVTCASNDSKIINGDSLSAVLMPLSNVERDKVWTTAISEALSTDFMQIALWGWGVSKDAINSFKDLTLIRTTEVLVWCLATTNIRLRDVSTRALINMLSPRLKVLSRIIRRFKDVGDMYILDRLWAVAFGCCVNNCKKEEVQEIADLANELIFAQPHVIDHILIRDYAKNIIQYAESIGCKIARDKNLFNKPFNQNVVLPVMPNSGYIKKMYEEDYGTVPDNNKKEEWSVKRNITDSMKTEHSPRGMYGDFGRYVFQSSLSGWPENPEDLANWAIDYIFKELGYNPSAFKKFDKWRSSNDRSRNRIERIGKKYQWISMYYIMAILSDVHYGESKLEEWDIPGVIKARNIDPTLTTQPEIPRITEGQLIYKVPQYNLNIKNPTDNDKWMKDYNDMPDIKRLLDIKDANGNAWVNLYSYNTIEGDVSSSTSREKSADRELWIFVQSIIVDKCNCSKLTSIIHRDGLEGRNSMENSDSYSIFYREFYWSDLYKSEIKDHGYFNRPYSTNHRKTLFDVQPTYLPYIEESSSDQSIEDSINIIMPSEYLYNGLNMHFGEGEGVWKNKNGEIICVDNSIYDNGSQALLVRKDALLAYLKRVSKVIVWPILMQRTLKNSSTYWPRHQAGGYVWMDSNGKFHYRFRLYVPSFMDKQKAKFYKHFPNFNYDKALLLHTLHIKRLSKDEIFQIQLNRMGIEDHNKYWKKKFGIIDKDLIVDKNK